MKNFVVVAKVGQDPFQSTIKGFLFLMFIYLFLLLVFHKTGKFNKEDLNK
jgi:hypothetical protein